MSIIDRKSNNVVVENSDLNQDFLAWRKKQNSNGAVQAAYNGTEGNFMYENQTIVDEDEQSQSNKQLDVYPLQNLKDYDISVYSYNTGGGQ